MIDVDAAAAEAALRIGLALGTIDTEVLAQKAAVDMMVGLYLTAYLSGKTPREVAEASTDNCPTDEQWQELQQSFADVASDLSTKLREDGLRPGPEAT